MNATAPASVKKPRVIGIALLSVIGGVLSIIGGVALLGLISAANAGATPDTAVPGYVTILAYVTIILGVIDILAAILLFMYKKLGLYLARLSYCIAVLFTIYNIGSQNTTIGSSIVGLIIDAAVLYYVYIYLTREPDKSFFS